MQRSLRLSLSLSGVTALAFSNAALLPAAAQEAGSADDLGVMEINLKDAVKFNWGFQGALQGAGTPNQAGIGGFLPIAVGENSVFFADVLLNANFSDREGDSSIVNTDVAGTTVSTSTRLGYRWLNGDRSWMYGLNGGYDSRPMNTGNADSGVTLYDKESAFFQQIAAGLEAVSDTWNFNAYALIPVGDTDQRLNSRYFGGALDTYGLDVGYFITPDLNASVGYYYQSGDLGEVDGSGVQVDLDYQIADDLTAGINVSYDEAFETRVTGNIEYRFGSNSTAAETKKKAWQKPTIQALSEAVKHRNIRVYDRRTGSGVPNTCYIRAGFDYDKDVPLFKKGYQIGDVLIRNVQSNIDDFYVCEPGQGVTRRYKNGELTGKGWAPAQATTTYVQPGWPKRTSCSGCSNG